MTTLDDPINVIDPSTVSPRPAGMKWGIIGGGIYIVISLVSYLTGFSAANANPGAVSYLITFVLFAVAVFCVVKSIQDHRAELGGYIRGGRCITVGMWSGVFYGLVSAVWGVIFYNIIAPDFYEEMMSTLTVFYEEQGMADEEIDMILGFASMFSGVVGTVFSALFSGILSGIILAVIPALIMKKKIPGQFQ